jgi:Family of unknown function (DUF6636)
MRAFVLAALVAVALPGAAQPLGYHFRTPSGNISCFGESTFIRCDIARTSVKPPPKPRSCEFDWGNAFGLGQRGRGHRLCVSDSTFGARQVLNYGRTIRIGRRLSCTSRRIGLTCRNSAGHGFFLSRDAIRPF